MSTVITPFQGTDSFSTATFNNRISQINTGFSYISNPNLLDNWYFANCVDQRQGRIVKPNTTYYSDNQLTTSAGTTSAYVTAYRYATGTANDVNYASFKLTDSDTAPTYYAAQENVVRGYTGAGYGIDRLKIVAPGVLLVTDDGINLKLGASTYGYSVFSSIIEGAKKLLGETVTLSVLTTNGLFSNSGVLVSAPSWVTPYAASSYVRPYFNGNLLIVEFIVISDSDPDIIAVKLELGSQQTLAHQGADGNWVLNEIPDYGEQLRRCQRYCNVIKAVSVNSRYGYGIGTGGNILVFVPINVPLRAVPTITMVGDFITWSGATPQPATFIAFDSVSTNGVTFSINSNDMTVGQVFQFIDAGTGNSAIILDANL